jgi:hypothetical protein
MREVEVGLYAFSGMALITAGEDKEAGRAADLFRTKWVTEKVLYCLKSKPDAWQINLSLHHKNIVSRVHLISNGYRGQSGQDTTVTTNIH